MCTIPDHLSDTKAVPGTRGQARIRTLPDTGHILLFVRFANGKWRDVGLYATHAEAHDALTNRTYGF